MPKFRNQLKQTRALFKTLVKGDKNFPLKMQKDKRFRIVQSITAGHVRGGHSFH